MSLLLRKYFWVLNLVAIALCALFAAQAVGRLVEANLPTVQSRPAPPRAPTLHQALGDHSRDITPILQRNIFCSTCEPVVETPTTASGNNNAPASNEPIKTSLNLKLIATLVSDEDKAWSFAAIEEATEQKTGMFAIGAKVAGDAVITDIMERRVMLLNGGRHEYLEMGTDETGSSIEQGSPSPAVSFRTPRALPQWADIAKGIRKVGEGKYEIDRAALNKVLANTTMLARSARIVPSVRNGKPNGFKLYAIRPGSLYSLLGMFNGDTINAINGHAITTPDKALEVYTKLRNASHVAISFSRRGKSITHEYNIR